MKIRLIHHWVQPSLSVTRGGLQPTSQDVRRVYWASMLQGLRFDFNNHATINAGDLPPTTSEHDIHSLSQDNYVVTYTADTVIKAQALDLTLPLSAASHSTSRTSTSRVYACTLKPILVASPLAKTKKPAYINTPVFLMLKVPNKQTPKNPLMTWPFRLI